MGRSVQVRLRVREEMERKGLSQRDVAGMLDWSQSRVAKILTGRVELQVDDLEALCFAVGLQLTEAVRDQGLEFCADMTPSELRMLQRWRQVTPREREAIMVLIEAKTAGIRPEERRATPKKPVIPRGRNA